MRRYWVLGIVGIILAVAGAGIFGFDQWSKSDLSGSFVSSDDAQVVADMVQVGSLNAGRIVTVEVNIGSSVMEGQVIARQGLGQQRDGTATLQVERKFEGHIGGLHDS